MSHDVRLFRALPLPLQLLVFSQFAFNVGFYLVVPFLAAYFEDDLKLAGGLVGLILGLRTFSQQGLFFLGGAISDRVGVKPVVLLGIGIRIAGFVTLALTRHLALVVLGVVLIGLAAALFSPASESAIVGLAGELAAAGGPRRTQVLALQDVASRLGSSVGPALGGIMIFVPFQSTCLIAASIFAFIGLAHALWLPHGLRVGQPTRVLESFRVVLSNGGFLAFAVMNCVQLLAYNQLYLALPVEITRTGHASASITWYFLGASLFVVLLQSRVTRLTDGWSVQTVFRVGYVINALSFAVVAAVAWFPPPKSWLSVLPMVAFVLLLHLASMVIGPRARDTVAVLAREQRLGAHMGIMSSVGGLAVLLAGGPIGMLLEPARSPSAAAVVPWAVLAGLPLVSAVVAGPLLSWLLGREPKTPSEAAAREPGAGGAAPQPSEPGWVT